MFKARPFLLIAFAQVSALAAALIGTASLVGYILKSPYLYNWSDRAAPMALNTSICFILVGLAVFFIAHDKKV